MIDCETSSLREKALVPSKKKKIIVLSGPTGVGKTELSLRIASVLGGEVISADSMQVYRGMDIGTAKVRSEDRKNIRHHLIDSRDLDESFSVVDFFNEARQSLKEIFARDHVPIIVGGSGFYVHSLIYGPPKGPPSVPEVRKKFQDEIDEKGATALYMKLKELDPVYAATLSSRDQYKIVRAFEIMTLTNQRVSSFQQNLKPDEELDFRCWFLFMPKKILYEKLDKRCEEMLANGFMEEVKKLEQQGIRKNIIASRAIGYRQSLDFLLTKQSHDDWTVFINNFKKASHRYVKRQLTWFQKEPLFRWLRIVQTGPETGAELIIQDYEQN